MLGAYSHSALQHPVLFPSPKFTLLLLEIQSALRTRGRPATQRLLVARSGTSCWSDTTLLLRANRIYF